MKKTITGLFAGTAALALPACGGEAPAAEETVVEVEEVAAPDEAMTEEMSEEAAQPAEETAETPLDGTGTPIGPSAVEGE